MVLACIKRAAARVKARGGTEMLKETTTRYSLRFVRRPHLIRCHSIDKPMLTCLSGVTLTNGTPVAIMPGAISNCRVRTNIRGSRGNDGTETADRATTSAHGSALRPNKTLCMKGLVLLCNAAV